MIRLLYMVLLVVAVLSTQCDIALAEDMPAQKDSVILLKEIANENASIEKKLESCKEAEPFTVGIIKCQNIAYAAYDTLMNEVYQEALKRSEPATRDAVKAAQRKWLSFRDAEQNAQAAYPRKGTLRKPMLGYEAIGLVQRRIKELTFYLEDAGG